MAEEAAPTFFERPRMVFAFGAHEESYFIGCGEQMEWNGLPDDLDSILKNRAHEVLAIALGEGDAFYCRYIAKKTKKEYTVTGSLPTKLEFLLNAWWANQYEVPHISFGPSRSFFFQMSSMTAWDHVPKQLEETLLQLRDSASADLLPRALTLGHSNSFILLSGENGESAVWNNIDEELAWQLQKISSDEENKKLMELAVLSPWNTEDYVLLFQDGSVFYSVPDALVEKVQMFVKIWHQALMKYAGEKSARMSRATTPAPEKEEEKNAAPPKQEYNYQTRSYKPPKPRRHSNQPIEPQPQHYVQQHHYPSPPPEEHFPVNDYFTWSSANPANTSPHSSTPRYPYPNTSPSAIPRDIASSTKRRESPMAPAASPNSKTQRRYEEWYAQATVGTPPPPYEFKNPGSGRKSMRGAVRSYQYEYVPSCDPGCGCGAGQPGVVVM